MGEPVRWSPQIADPIAGLGDGTVRLIYGPRPNLAPEGEYGLREPQAFAVTRGIDNPIHVHFHPVSQFQYVFDGSARFGREVAGGGVVQFSDAFTPYGPIVPGAAGLAFLTLRAVSDHGVMWMPESRELLRSGIAAIGDRPRRNLVIDLRVREAGWHELRSDHDGLVIGAARLAAEEQLALPTVGGDGAYLVVVDGSIVATDGERTVGGTVAWCASGTTPMVQAGGSGACLGLLQLPRSAVPRTVQAGS